MTDEVAMPLGTGEFNRLMSRQRADLGNFSEMIAAAAFFRAGCMVSKPLGVSKGYDLIVDDGERLLRVQVKTISTSNQAAIGQEHYIYDWDAAGAKKYEVVPKYTNKSFDALACVDRKTSEVFLVPMEDVDLTKAYVSMKPSNRDKYRFVAL